MSEIGSNADILQQVRDALDGGLTTTEKPVSASDYQSPAEGIGINESKGGDTDYIEIDDYCKMLQDSRENESLLLAPMDSRSLVPKHQTKLDSQHTPHSISDLHDRITSFDMIRWSQKPDCISSFECARFGWKLSEWGFLMCVTCKQIVHIPPQMSKLFHSPSWAERLRRSVETIGHLTTCPWTKIPSSPEILSVPHGTSLYTYLCEAVNSFKLMRTFPTLESHYKMILVDLNLKWLAEVTSATSPKEDDLIDKSVNADMVRDMALFLVLSGWTMSDTEDLIKCKLCLREVPLWLCQPMPAENEILDLLSPPASPARKLNKDFSYKELDPVSNHWSWCPWRQQLQHKHSVPPVKNDSEKTDLAVTVSDSENIDLKKAAEISDYERVLEYFQQECANMSLRYDKEKTGVHLLTSVSSFMDNITASPAGLSRSSTPVCSETVSEPGTEIRGESPSVTLGDHIDLSQTAQCNEVSTEQPEDSEKKTDEPPKKRIRRELFDGSSDGVDL